MNRRGKIPLAYVLGLLVAAILVIAAFFKAGDPAMFADEISSHKVTPASWSPVLAYVFVAIELALAVAFLAFVWPRFLFASTILLMLGFIFVTAWAWAHGNAEGCACFGRLVDRGPLHVIIEDTLVVLASVAAIFLTRGFVTRAWRWALFAILMVPVVALTGFGASLPLDGVVIGIHRGSDLSDMVLEGTRAPVDEGKVLITIIGPNCPACAEGLASLREIAAERMVPRVLGAYAGSAAEAQGWRLKHLPNFLIAHAPAKVLRQYYRRLPVTFLLEDGTVQEVWWNRVPTPDDVRHCLALSGE
jgi:uncharacterized membrane protein YphA (DoxX/SURF4 family)